MSRILIVYESKHGQTEKIVQFIRDRMKSRGNEVELMNCQRPSVVKLANFDAVIVGAPIYARRYPAQLRKWVRDHAEELNRSTTAFFSVCLAVLQKDEKVQRDLLLISEAFFRKTGWYPKRRRVFAGALVYSDYNWFLKRVMRMISRRGGQDTDIHQDYEYTHWNEVTRFADEFLNSLQEPREFGRDELSP